jgi:PAS domain S-box-containing protein
MDREGSITDMNRSSQKLPRTHLSPLRITAIYVIFGGLWIILSSQWASSQAAAPESFLHLEIVKGLLYIVLTAALLWFLCRSWSRQLKKAAEAQHQTQVRYEAYVKNSPISITVMDRQGQILEANAATEKLTGYSRGELQGMDIFALDATVGQDETRRVFSEIFETGQAVRERILQRKDGTHIDVKVDGVRFEGEQAICFARDITERIQHERKLLMLNAMLRAIRRVNKAIIEATEIEDLIQKICDVLVQDRDFKHAWIALMGKDDRPVHYCDAPKLKDAAKLKAFLNEGKLEACLSETRSEDGLVVAQEPRSQCPDFPIMRGLEDCALLGMHFKYDDMDGYIAMMANPEIVDDEEEISLFREVCGDLQYALHTIGVESEKTQALADLIEAKQAAEDANRAKDDFLAVMSHELRTPLNPIIGFSEMLTETIRSEPEKTYVDTILKAGNRQLELIDDILQYMQLHRSKVKMSPVNFRLFDLCKSVIRDASANSSKLDLRLTRGAHGKAISKDLEVVSDPQALRSILDNLINNACKYTKKGQVQLDLSEVSDAPGEWIFTVEDTGIGIEPDIREKLFEAFSQADSSYTRRHEGIGLGLAICKELVGLLNGGITVESTPGQGSTFTVRLPLDAPSDAARAALTPTENKARVPHARFDRAVHVLAVDDQPDNLFVLDKMLTRAGGQVTRAGDGAVAVELCREHEYDIILMDLAMPVMNGMEASQAIRAGSSNAKTPIIAVTADASPEIQKPCEKADIQAILTKPIQAGELIELIQKHLR